MVSDCSLVGNDEAASAESQASKHLNHMICRHRRETRNKKRKCKEKTMRVNNEEKT